MGKTAGLIIVAAMLCCMHVYAGDTTRDSIPGLPTVHVRSRGAGVHVRQDTIEYQAMAYKGPEVRKVQDLLARLEGFSVSPEGRVYFNGQEVETILVNGEDMAGNNYRLLSRYLRAGLVKKVQLIRNYDPDPLMHEMRRSGKVGLSLVLHDSLARTVSGGVDVGASLSGRKDMDLHLLDLHGPAKTIGLGSWNSTGITGTNNREFYAREEGLTSEMTQAGGIASPVQAALIHAPALPDAYVRENDDRNGSVIWKRSLEAGCRIGFIVGADRGDLTKTQWQDSRYAPPDGSSWEMKEKEYSYEHDAGYFLRSEYVADRGHRGRSQAWLDAIANRDRNAYSDTMTGALDDRLREMSDMGRIGLQGHIRESRRLRAGALQVEADLYWQRERQHFAVAGTHLSGIGLDSGKEWVDQCWRSVAIRQGLLLRYVPVKQGWSTGWVLRYQGREGTRRSVWGADELHGGNTSLARHALTVEWEGEHRAGRNAGWKWSGAAGWGSWRYGADGEIRVTLLHDLSVGYERRTGPFRSWGFNFRDVKALPDEQYVLPASMISGKYTLISPQLQWKPTAVHQLSMRYSSRSLAMGAGMMFLLSCTRREQEILPAYVVKPGVMVIQPMLSGRSDELQGNFSGDLFLAPVRMKLHGDLHLVARWGRALVNGVWSDREMRNGGAGLRLATSWKTFVNVDAGWTLDNGFHRDRTSMGEQCFSGWSNTMRVKLRARWHEKWYAAMVLERYAMPGLPAFFATDLFLTWQCHERLSFSVTGHNLLDRKQAATRWVSAGAEGETVFRVVPAYVLWKLSWAI